LKAIVIDEIYCKGCRLCITNCHKDVYEMSSVRNAKGYLMPKPARIDDCNLCLMCEMICPDMAITVKGDKDEE
jgi:2-oxoglutarate ferredoxin oxidoreductase subunit delta